MKNRYSLFNTYSGPVQHNTTIICVYRQLWTPYSNYRARLWWHRYRYHCGQPWFIYLSKSAKTQYIALNSCHLIVSSSCWTTTTEGLKRGLFSVPIIIKGQILTSIPCTKNICSFILLSAQREISYIKLKYCKLT